jgi:hypothetical protein
VPRPAHFRPDYSGGGFVNLIASLAEARGGRPRHAPLAMLAARELREATNVVFMIIDGLGDRYLGANGAGGALMRHRRGSISAVFPSTTATAITAGFTGATPAEHGLTGWYTYFSETACVGAPLPFVRRGDKRPLGVPPGRLFVEPPFFDTLADRVIVVTWKVIVDAIYNAFHCGRAERRSYDSLDGFVEQAAAAARSGPERKFIYAYWPEFDALSHQHGVGSAPVRGHFAALDQALGRLLERLAGSDTIVVVTADHGFVDVPAAEAVDLPPSLAAQLRFPLCGERRVAFCHVHDRRSFVERAKETLGESADIRPSWELVEEGWFGPGRPHARFAERIGDVAIVMHGRGTVKDRVPGEKPHDFIGDHGGTSEDEMRIPLVVAKT